MGSVKTDLFADFTNRRLVESFVSTNPKQIADFFQEDKLRWYIQCQEINPNGYAGRAPYASIDGSGVSLVVKIAKASDGTILASNSSWSVVDGVLVGTIDCNTAAMVTAMTGVTSVAVIVEFEFTDADGVLTIQQTGVSVKKEYITAGSPVALPLDQYPTTTEMFATCLTKSPDAFESKLWVSPDGTKKVLQYLDDNGTMQFDPQS